MKKMILISAIWCPSCLIMRPRYQEIVSTLHIDEFVEYDFDDDEDKINKYNVGKVLPVCILFEDDQEIMRVVGEKNSKELKKIFSLD